jgi:hypothetical protein
MANLFDEFGAEEPQYIDMAHFETDAQLRLRERFRSLADRNAQEIILFDPHESHAFRPIKIRSGESECEKAEPQLAHILRREMLRASGLDVPENKDDPRLIVERYFANGTRSLIFVVTRDDESLVPVYCEVPKTDGTPKGLYLISFDKAQETALQYRELDEYRSKLGVKLEIGGRALSGLSVEDLKEFNDTYDDIQWL